MVRARVVILVAVGLLGGGCGQEDKPVSVPMEAVPMPPETGQRQAPDLTDSAVAAAPTGGRGPSRTPAGTASKKASEAPIDSCCGALLDKANAAPDEATKRLYDQAAAICYRRAKSVREGKMSRGEALAQVRSSLLGPAPAACN